jgi:hypothetical protein
VIEHVHPLAGKAAWDEGYHRANGEETVEHDKRAYDEWREAPWPRRRSRPRRYPGGGMKVVFLVPRRKDDGPRDRIWAYCRARWERLFPDVEVVEGHHDDGAFNRSAAINRAAELADEGGPWDIGIVIDADVVLSESQVRAAIETAAETGRVTWAHRRWRGVREDATRRILDDRRDLGAELDRDELDLIVERTNPLSWSCCIAMPRAVFDDLGGFDERFEGWGFEDMAFQSVICGLYGYERIPGDVVHLWHPRSEERITPGETRLTATPEYVTNARLGRRYMVALRRDYALHDRGDQPPRGRAPPRHREPAPRRREVLARGRAPQAAGLVDLVADARGAPRRREGVPRGTWPDRRRDRRRPDGRRARDVGGAERVPAPVARLARRARQGPDRPAGHLLRLGRRPPGRARGDRRGARLLRRRPRPPRLHGRRARLWRYLENRALGDYVFVAEDDFVYLRDVDLVPMAETLRDHPEVRQVALLRGPATRASSRGTASSAGRRSRSRRRTRATATAASSTATSGR